MTPAPARQPPRPALEDAFAEHYAFVRERLRGLGVAAADLDDATQDVFEVLVRRIADYDPQRPIRAWMAGMARKVARRYRDRGRRGIVPLDERRAAIDDSPEDRAARAEAWAVLQRFVDELEPERWSVFVLSEIEGLRGSEIAAELGVNLNTVYARLRSARMAFERTLRRHRARERRAVFVWMPPRRWVLWGGLTLSGGLAVSAIVVSCEGEEQVEESRLESQPETSSRRVATRTIEPTSVRTLTSDSTPADTPAATGEDWIAGTSGFSSNRNAKGEGYTLSVENRYRFDGDRVIFERTYIGDDDVAVDSVETQLTLDGLELVDGELEWELSLAPEEVKVVTTTLRASRGGVVQLHVGSSNGSSTYEWINEAGLLRGCEEHECEAPIGEERLSGERITVHVHNQCAVTKEFVLFAGYPDVRPSASVKVHSLEPDERRSMEIDAAQWFLHRHPDGHVGGGVHTDSDGGLIEFFGSGDDCDGASASSPDIPRIGPA